MPGQFNKRLKAGDRSVTVSQYKKTGVLLPFNWQMSWSVVVLNRGLYQQLAAPIVDSLDGILTKVN